MRVADVGAGYGFFAFPAAETVGDDGMVYAVEPDPRRAEQIEATARGRGVKNLRVVVAAAEDLSSIPSGEVDVAMSMSSFHHFSDAQRGLSEMGRVVKAGGLVYIRDMKPGRLFKHGSASGEFRRSVLQAFPAAEFEEGPGYLVARVRL